MTKMLDLDAIAPQGKVVVLLGKRYEMCQLTLRDFINLSREAEKITKAVKDGTMSEVDVLEAYLDQVKSILKGIEREVLDTLTGDQLAAIVAFARETAASEAPKAEAPSGNVPTVTSP